MEDTIVTWDAFKEAFKARFISAEHREAWWSKIEAVKQGNNETIKGVVYKLQELFSLVGAIDEIFQVRYFMHAINPNIAYRMEESGVSMSWKEAINKAVRTENAQKKYLLGQGGDDLKVEGGNLGVSMGFLESMTSTIKPDDLASQTNTLLTQVADSLSALQLQLGSSSGPSRVPPNYPPHPPPTCWHCGQTSHISSHCPRSQNQQGNSNQGNGNRRQ